MSNQAAKLIRKAEESDRTAKEAWKQQKKINEQTDWDVGCMVEK